MSACIFMACFSILVNGTPCGFFGHKDTFIPNTCGIVGEIVG
jgi:hypothetical protein